MLLFFYHLPPAYFVGSSPIWGLTFYLQAFVLNFETLEMCSADFGHKKDPPEKPEGLDAEKLI